jgi:hypothetical protein
LTPFTTAKNWSLDNTGNDDLIMTEDDFSLALEFIDFGGGIDNPTLNTSCSLALEQQEADAIHYREGLKLTGNFYPGQDPTNVDGTYKRVVYAQIKTTFYNEYRNPTKMWGIDDIDFELAKTKKYLADQVKLFDIPQIIFGERLVEKSVELFDNTLDDSFTIADDGDGNLIASKNLFSRFQEIGDFANVFQTGSNNLCDDYLNFNIPIAPVLTATLVDTTPYVALAWTDAVNETGYVLERSINSGSTYSVLAYPAANVLTYNDAAVTINTIYWYRIYAFNAFGNGPYSNTASVLISNPPVAPSNLSASLQDDPLTPQVYLTFTDNSSNELGFYMERSNNSGSSFSPEATLAPNISWSYDTDVIVEGGTTYWYRVRAWNIYGSSSWSNVATQSVWNPPAAPSDLTASLSGSSSSFLNWVDNSYNEVGFFVQRAPGTGSTFATIQTVGANITESSDWTTVVGSTYTYRVCAYNGYGSSSFTNTASITIPSDFLYDLTGSLYISGPYDTFESYTSGSVPANGGYGWSGSWQSVTLGAPGFILVVAEDNLTDSGYTSGSVLSGLDGGNGWGGPWSADIMPRSINLVVYLRGLTTASLGWVTNRGFDGIYKIWKSTGTGPFSVINEVAEPSMVTPSTSSYNDFPIVEGTSYSYSIEVVSTFSSSLISATQSISVPTVYSPDVFPMLAWFKADDINIGDGDVVGTGSGAWTSSYSYASHPAYPYGSLGVASQTTTAQQPTYSLNQFGTGRHGVRFNGVNSNLTLSHPKLPRVPYFMAAVYQVSSSVVSGREWIYAGNSALQAKRVGTAPNVSSGSLILAHSFYGDFISNTFSSSMTQSTVGWVGEYSSSANKANKLDFFENKYLRGGHPGNLTVNMTANFTTIGVNSTNTMSGSLAELCVWTASMTASDIVRMFDDYFLPRYPDAGFYVV